MLIISRRRLQQAAEQKPDPLLQVPATLENGPITLDRQDKTISRQTSKSESTGGDYAYRQQMRPLIPRPDSETYTKPGDPQPGLTLAPPPYHNSWTTDEIARYHNQEYESPRNTSGYDHSRVAPVAETPPVYFELDSPNKEVGQQPGHRVKSPAPPPPGLADGQTNHCSI